MVMSILDIVKDTLKTHNASRVTQITLVLGEFVCVEPKALSSCFEIFAQGTPAEGANLVFERISTTRSCVNCEKIYEKSDEYNICQTCGGKIAFSGGREFYLKSLELESEDSET